MFHTVAPMPSCADVWIHVPLQSTSTRVIVYVMMLPDDDGGGADDDGGGECECAWLRTMKNVANENK